MGGGIVAMMCKILAACWEGNRGCHNFFDLVYIATNGQIAMTQYFATDHPLNNRPGGGCQLSNLSQAANTGCEDAVWHHFMCTRM